MEKLEEEQTNYVIPDVNEYICLEDSMICDIFNMGKIYCEKKLKTDVKFNDNRFDPTHVNEIYNVIFNKIEEHKELTKMDDISVINEIDIKKYIGNVDITDDNVQLRDYYTLIIDDEKLFSKSLISLFVQIITKQSTDSCVEWNIIDKK